MVYGIESDILEESEVLSEEFEGDSAADWRIRDSGIGIFLMEPQTRDPLCWMEMHVPGGKGSCMVSLSLQSCLQVGRHRNREIWEMF